MNSAEILTVSGQVVILAVGILGYLATRSRVEKVHKLVNTRSEQQDKKIDDQDRRIAQLTGTLHDADVAVPNLPAKEERLGK